MSRAPSNVSTAAETAMRFMIGTSLHRGGWATTEQCLQQHPDEQQGMVRMKSRKAQMPAVMSHSTNVG
ncbi:MAG: hypothetical protein IPK20_21570 [Betaproteobacteria bacterium]|nr:hypothetical protein [Betaproteobacteria bacterium]